jgi:hypothetical protein
MLKDIALEIELPDVRKREIISKKTGFNIDNILYVKKTLNKETNEANQKTDEKKTRKAEPLTTENKRRTEPVSTKSVPEYKVLSVNK